ncbi:MAG: aminotransferase, partial [Hylemonella sp.]|nr:aminotransferase [Hylemonella sp.]
ACGKLQVKDSWEFAFELMRRAGVAVTPGRDFGNADTARFVRFSTASSLPQLQQAAQRLRDLLG